MTAVHQAVYKEIPARWLLELIGSLNLGNVWVFEQLISGPGWPMNQLNKNKKLPNLRLPISSVDYPAGLPIDHSS